MALQALSVLPEKCAISCFFINCSTVRVNVRVRVGVSLNVKHNDS